MQINLTGHHVEITDSLRNYVDTKFSKLERHFDHISNVHVILNVEKLNRFYIKNRHNFSSKSCLERRNNQNFVQTYLNTSIIKK